MNVPILFPIQIGNSIFVPITDFAVEGIKKDSYYINCTGEIYSKLSNKYLTPVVSSSNGYYMINLRLENGESETCLLHRIMMITFKFVWNYKELFVNHINGIKTDCRLENMEWCTLQENNRHARDTGLLCVGEDCPWSVLTESQVREICFIIENNQYKSITELANRYNCSVTTIGDIVRGISWKHISKDYNLNYKIRSKFTEDEIHFMCNVFSQNKNLSFQYLYYIIIFHLNLEDDKLIRRRIYKIYTKDPYNYYNITSQYDY